MLWQIKEVKCDYVYLPLKVFEREQDPFSHSSLLLRLYSNMKAGKKRTCNIHSFACVFIRHSSCYDKRKEVSSNYYWLIMTVEVKVSFLHMVRPQLNNVQVKKSYYITFNI